MILETFIITMLVSNIVISLFIIRGQRAMLRKLRKPSDSFGLKILEMRQRAEAWEWEHGEYDAYLEREALERGIWTLVPNEPFGMRFERERPFAPSKSFAKARLELFGAKRVGLGRSVSRVSDSLGRLGNDDGCCCSGAEFTELPCNPSEQLSNMRKSLFGRRA